MRLRTRFSLVLAIFSLIIIPVVAMLARYVVMKTALRADEEMASAALDRGIAILIDEADSLAKTTVDWAAWNDTYAFVKDRSQSYIDSNLTAGTLEGLRLHVLAYYDTNQHVVACQVLESDGERPADMPGLLRRQIEGADGLLALAGQEQAASGYLWEGSNLWLVGAAQILTSNDEGPSRGTLLMARRLAGPELERLSHLIHPSLVLTTAAAGWVPGRKDIGVRNLHTVRARAAVADVFGRGRVLLDLTLPRVAFGQVSVSILYLTAWIVACGGAVSLFSFWMLNRWVLQSITESVEAIRSGVALRTSSDAMPPRLKKRHADEIGDLIDAVNAMLAAHGAAQEGLRLSEARYRGLVEATPEAMAGLDHDCRILFANRAFERFAGVSNPGELTGRDLYDVLPTGDARRVETELATIQPGQSLELGAVEMNVLGGGKCWFLTVVTRIGAADGQPAYGLLCMHDITDRVNSEREADRRREEALQAQKLAALGTLVAGIAHEANNPNGVVKLNMNVLQRSLGRLFAVLRSGAAMRDAASAVRDQELARLEQELNEIVTETLAASERIAGLISSLKSFSQPSRAGDEESVDVVEIMQTALEWVRHDIKEKQCRLECELDPNLPRVRGDRQQLLQVVINLLQNACYAADLPGMRLQVTDSTDRDAGTVTMTIADEGRGIPEEDIEHVMDPFFTTRRGKGGTGLGLSISAAIVKAHGGTLHIQSSEGKGTIVTVTLPAESGGEYAA